MSSRIASLLILLAVSLVFLVCLSSCDSGEDVGEKAFMLPSDVPLKMLWIPAGTFMMGRYSGEEDSYIWEDPQHKVKISRGFWLGKYEVTQAQWRAIMGTAPGSRQGDVHDIPDSLPVAVGWYDAQDFITALNAQTGESFRLPSEAEWEYACRAGTTTRFSYGDDSGYHELSNYAWWRGNTESAGARGVHVVGQKLPNPWGLYDMHGNVWEWCQDWWHADYVDAPTNGSAWESRTGSGSVRLRYGRGFVKRGGGCQNAGGSCRSTSRDGLATLNIGFRLARD